MKPHFPTTNGRRRAYILLEVIIALTVFSIVAVGLAVALQSSIESVNFLTREAVVRRGLDAMLIEAKKKPKREEMAFAFRDELLGIDYATQLEELKFVNLEGRPVSGLFLLVATARYQVDGQERNDRAEVYVHRP